MTGQTISHYKILEKIGEGGMGIVYKAEDITLGRHVALKVLPPSLIRTDEIRKRFINEAKAVSTLDHPNICTVYELGDADANQMFIAMAYYEGHTVREKTKVRPLPLGEVIDIAIGVAQGLSKAHENGIVHRDIKTDNIMITRGGEVKIMDFGVASFLGASTLTKAGTAVGTMPYMSPEQARGERIDHRTDIWSLGIVIYEMVTGQLPFKSEYHAALVYSILNEVPIPVTAQRTGVPIELDRIITKCLEKETARRYQHIDEMIVDLKKLKESPADIDNATFRKRRGLGTLKRKGKLAAGAVGSLVVIVVVLLIWPTEQGVRLNANMKFRTVPTGFREIQRPKLSRDGNWIAFRASDADNNWDIYWMHSSGGEARRITFDSLDMSPRDYDISSDGSRMVYESPDPKTHVIDLYVVSSLGGPRDKIATNAHRPRWRPDNKRIGYVRPSQTSQHAEYRSVDPIARDDRLEFVDTSNLHALPESFGWSPDGKSLLLEREFSGGISELVVHELATDKERQITSDNKRAKDPFWVGKESIIFSSNRAGNMNLWMKPLSDAGPLQITHGSGPDVGPTLSDDGKRLLFSQIQNSGYIHIADLRSGQLRQITFDDELVLYPSFSPDRKQISFVVVSTVPNLVSHLYSIDREGRNRRQLTFGAETISEPTWSPDGRWIAYCSFPSSATQSDSSQVYVIDVLDPREPPKRIGQGTWVLAWRNPEILIVSSGHATWEVSLNGTHRTKLFEDSTLARPVVNGKYLLYTDYRNDRHERFVVLSDELDKARKRSLRRLLFDDYLVRVSKDSKYLLYVPIRGELWKVSLPDGRKERVPNIFPGVQVATDIDVSADWREAVFVNKRVTTKIVIVDDFFD